MLQSETDTQNHDGDDELDEVSVAAPTSPISINNSSSEKISDESKLIRFKL
ncbi:unnamed protein product, partial [Rotaria magnacalcarata]